MKKLTLIAFIILCQSVFAYKINRDEKTGGYRLKCANHDGEPTGLYSSYQEAQKASINCPNGVNSIESVGIKMEKKSSK
jgi:hypothetical protein